MEKCHNSAGMDASIEKVWDTTKGVHSLSWSDQIVIKVDVVGAASGTEVGAKRILNNPLHARSLTCLKSRL